MVNESPLLFQKNSGEPAAFYLHQSINNEFQRENLKDQIIVRNKHDLNITSVC